MQGERNYLNWITNAVAIVGLLVCGYVFGTVDTAARFEREAIEAGHAVKDYRGEFRWLPVSDARPMPWDSDLPYPFP